MSAVNKYLVVKEQTLSGQTWIDTSSKRFLLEANSIDCGYQDIRHRWVESITECINGKRDVIQTYEESQDGGITWNEISSVTSSTIDCIEPIFSSTTTTSCFGYDLYRNTIELVSYDNGRTWYKTGVVSKGSLFEANSSECGCEDGIKWVVYDTTCDNDYNLFAIEKEFKKEDGSWVETGIIRYRLLETNSEACGYVYQNYQWIPYDSLCIGADKYKLEKKQIRNGDTWVDTNPLETRVGELEEAGACSTAETLVRYVEDGTTCEGYDLYSLVWREFFNEELQEWVRDTGFTQTGRLLRENSPSCDYQPSKTIWVIDTATTICDGYNEYYIEREYVSTNNLIVTTSGGGICQGIIAEHKWEISTGETICDGYKEYGLEYGYIYVSYDSGETWVWELDGTIKKGDLIPVTGNCDNSIIWTGDSRTICIENDLWLTERQYIATGAIRPCAEPIVTASTACGYSTIISRWVESTGETICDDNHNLYHMLLEEISEDEGITWIQTGNIDYGTLIEENSTACTENYRCKCEETTCLKCLGPDLYLVEKEQVSDDGGHTYIDTGNYCETLKIPSYSGCVCTVKLYTNATEVSFYNPYTMPYLLLGTVQVENGVAIFSTPLIENISENKILAKPTREGYVFSPETKEINCGGEETLNGREEECEIVGPDTIESTGGSNIHYQAITPQLNLES